MLFCDGRARLLPRNARAHRPCSGWLALLSAVGCVACGASEGPAATVLEAPTTVVISELQVAGGLAVARGEADCFEVADGPATLLVSSTTANWILRPVDACGVALRCGALQLTLTPEDTALAPVRVYSAVPVLSVDLESVGLDLTRGAEVSLELLLVDDELRPFSDPSSDDPDASCAERETCDELRVSFAQSCD